MDKGQVKYAIITVDYFTKWAEAEPLATITERRTTDFIWCSIVCRFGLPQCIVTDNGKQFDNANFREFCWNLSIQVVYASPAHPQTNGQVEAMNKIIKHLLKTRLEGRKGAWAEQLPEVLWAYRTTHKTSIGETPFSLTFETEVVVPVEIGMPSPRIMHYCESANNSQLAVNLDLLEEVRDRAQVQRVAYQHRVAKFFNSNASPRSFTVGDLVLHKVLQNTRKASDGVLGAN